MSDQNFASGSFLGTGQDIEIKSEKCGFKPTIVRLVNKTDVSFAEWKDTMADASMLKQKAGTTSFVTSKGITPLASGFKLGTDTDLNASGDEIHFEAWG